MALNLIFLGPPGSGKGTLASYICKDFDLCHISTGDILREEVKKQTKVGKEIKLIMEKGLLVSDELVTKMVEKRIKKKDCRNGFILDGYPRTINQVLLLEAILKKQKKCINLVVLLSLPYETIIKRLSGRYSCEKCHTIYNIYTLTKPKRAGICDKCSGRLIQREDDKLETINKRLKVYEADTKPLIEYYKKAGILKEIFVGDSIEENVKMVKNVIIG